MKRLLQFLLVMGVAFSLSAQTYSLDVSGTVTDANGAPVAGVDMLVSIQTSPNGYFYFNLLQTANDGSYTDHIDVPTSVMQGILTVGMADCDSTLVEQSVGFGQNGPNNFTFDFVNCANPPNFCEAWIEMDSVGNGVQLTAVPTGTAPFAYLWSTGETTATVTWDPNGALYCVTVTDATGCEASSCFGSPPPSCSVYISPNPAGGLTAVASGVAPFTYMWSTGVPTQTIFPNAPGNYCVTIADNNGCSSTACYQYNGGGTGNDSCGLVILIDSAGTGGWLLTAVANGEAPYTYLWNTQNASTPSIQVAGSGYYCVTVTAADGCIASDCFTIFANSCSVNIFEEDSSGVVYLVADALGANPLTYAWNSGETSYYIQPTAAGNYCVTVTDANGCQSSDCFTYDPLSGMYPFVVQGYVYLPDSTNANAIQGFAELYQFDANNIPTLFATVDIENDPSGWVNFYNFGAVPAGQYLVKINVDPNSPLFDDYVPTYYGNVELWNEATNINVPCNCNYPLYNVTMIEDENLTGGGEGEIAGTVTDGEGFTHGSGDNRGAGGPLPNVSILLYDAQENYLDHTFTDANGEYSFDNLPLGTYKLMVEITGMEQAERWVSLSADNPVSSGNNFDVTDEGILNGLADLISKGSFQVFPNPAKDVVNVYLETAGSFEATLALSSLTGQTVLAKTENLMAGKQAVQVELSNLPTGIYFLQVSTGKEVMVKKLVVE
ncbi:MAG: T9SS type A sorting domain-containing protein [Saprospiraceae bacterium]